MSLLRYEWDEWHVAIHRFMCECVWVFVEVCVECVNKFRKKSDDVESKP